MKTFAMTAIAATMVAGSAFAHPVNEPHICGIDPTMVMDYPGFAQEDGTIYDRGTYFFVATNDNDGSGEYTTTHTRIWKDSMEHNGVCRVTGVDIFHADDADAPFGGIVFEKTAKNEITARYMGEELVIPTNRAEHKAEKLNEGSMNGGVVELDRGAFSYDFSDQDQVWEELKSQASND